jgi:hypothetical protein
MRKLATEPVWVETFDPGQQARRSAWRTPLSVIAPSRPSHNASVVAARGCLPGPGDAGGVTLPFDCRMELHADADPCPTRAQRLVQKSRCCSLMPISSATRNPECKRSRKIAVSRRESKSLPLHVSRAWRSHHHKERHRLLRHSRRAHLEEGRFKRTIGLNAVLTREDAGQRRA